ncbi:hypothetical protein HX005_08250 [Acinetobacter sp. R933-2]|uniref:hypothetical protein n=1 Tax=Acinetobacter sp. R933-2 TaxID=2746728 RepID=UPI002575CD19|nr:hypothetical protein [Acinetobacter sp. R933-2]MDM1247378.1 hypothetical protein [Acinetobacter sp. R933-2]
MNIKFLVLVFIGIFFSCLGLSKLANFYFDISSDYLTATATFFAAFVALYLYSDWKDVHKINTLEKYHQELKIEFLKLNSSYLIVSEKAREIHGSSSSRVDMIVLEINKVYGLNFYNDVKKMIITITEYEIFISRLTRVSIVEQYLKNTKVFKNNLLKTLKALNSIPVTANLETLAPIYNNTFLNGVVPKSIDEGKKLLMKIIQCFVQSF